MSTETSNTNSQQDNTDSVRTYLIKGDISGIQGFIFNVKSDGAARSLKGRSFFLKILLEVGMQLVFDHCKPTNNREDAEISTSGGNFILKLEGDNIKQKISEIQAILTESLQYIDLDMMLCAVPWTDNFSEDKKQLNQAVRARKLQLLEGCDAKVFFEPFSKGEIKKVYGNPEKSDENKWTKIRDALKNHTHWKITPPKDNKPIPGFSIEGSHVNLAGYAASFYGKKPYPKEKNMEDRFNLENHLESVFPLVFNWRKKKKEDVINFEQMSEEDYGINKLGVLAMDVDGLGELIENIKKENEHKDLDKKLRHFFNNRLRTLVNKYYKDKVYTVTAGGDDTFFVGKWNTMLDIAIEINKGFNREFKDERLKLEKQGKNLSISAALLIVHPSFPVVRFAEMAEDALKNAKYKYPDSRGNISIFGEVIKWEVLEGDINELRNKFKSNHRVISSGLLAKARFTSLKTLEDEGLRLSDYWKLSYYMRDIRKDYSYDILEQYRKNIDKASNEKEEDMLKKYNYKLIFPIAARLAELDKR